MNHNRCTRCAERPREKNKQWCTRCVAILKRSRERRKGRDYLKKTGTGKQRIGNAATLYGSILSWKKHGFDSLVAVVKGDAQRAHSRVVRFVGTVQRSADQQRNEFIRRFHEARLSALDNAENEPSRVPVDL
jgi:hypothetical protein